MADGRATLECQDCGWTVRTLSPDEVRMVAANPYNFVAYCGPCRADRLKHAAQEWSVHPANLLELSEHLASVGVSLEHEGKPL